MDHAITDLGVNFQNITKKLKYFHLFNKTCIIGIILNHLLVFYI